MRFAARRTDLGCGGLDFNARACGEPDFRARFCERNSARSADTAAGAGDEGRAAVETKIYDVVSFFAPSPTS